MFRTWSHILVGNKFCSRYVAIYIYKELDHESGNPQLLLQNYFGQIKMLKLFFSLQGIYKVHSERRS